MKRLLSRVIIPKNPKICLTTPTSFSYSPSRNFQTCQTCLQTPPPSSPTQQSIGKMTPKYQIQFTCNVCGNRNIHEFSKHAYHNTVVICRCRKCENNHVIADNLGWFADLEGKKNIEEILREKGEEVVKVSMEQSFDRSVEDASDKKLLEWF